MVNEIYYDLTNTAEEINTTLSNLINNTNQENIDKVFTIKEMDGAVIIATTELPAPQIVEGEQFQLIVSNGEDWVNTENCFFTTYTYVPDGSEESITEHRFGPQLVTEQNKANSGKLVFTNDPKAYLTSNEDLRKYNFKLSLGDLAKVNFSDNTIIDCSDDTRFALKDKACLDLTGVRGPDLIGDYHSPELFMHGNSEIHVDDGYCYDNREQVWKYNYRPDLPFKDRVPSHIHLHDMSEIEMGEEAHLSLHNASRLEMDGNPRVSVHDNFEGYFAGNAFLQVSGDANVSFGEGSIFAMQSRYEGDNTSPIFRMSGNSKLLLNARKGYQYDPYDPAFILNPTSIVFEGQAGARTGEMEEFHFGSPEKLVAANQNPRIQIADETEIIIDAGRGTGTNYIKIGSGNKENLRIFITGNTFTQQTGNSHLEYHDNSKVIMRGPLKEGIKPWNDMYEAEEGSRRLIKNDNSPLLSMYDSPTFIMRGLWDTSNSEPATINSITLYTFPPEITENTTVEALTEETRAALLNMVLLSSNKPMTELVSGNIQYKETYTGSGDYCIEITNLVYRNNAPTGWSPTLEKIENNPLLEVIENAEVRLSGNTELKLSDFKITADKLNGITFSDGTDSVTFSIADLKSLKSLLTN